MNNYFSKLALKYKIKNVIGHIVNPYIRLKQSTGCSLTVFNYHDVTDFPSDFELKYGLNVSNKTFIEQITWINDTYNIISPGVLLTGEKISEKSALITFDDGFLGAFENGLKYLKKRNIPSVMFLNMNTIINQRPMFSAIINYMENHVDGFGEYMKKNKILKPYHLTVGPDVYLQIEEVFGKVDLHNVWRYQGALANQKIVKKWDSEPTVSYGNHLFEHWNAQALSEDELAEQYNENESILSMYKNTISLFAFTNGTPVTCFKKEDVDLIKKLGAKKIFSTFGGVNNCPNDYLLGRLSLVDNDNKKGNFWFRIFQAMNAETFRY